jgi:tRNA(Ile)-lysidine synthase TilS/MesJ/selenocysteine lyase/cysteine desulfurase
VFVGPYEHHSNLVPWRESGCEIVMVPECQVTHTVDFVFLERSLQKPEYEKRLKMGTFTAASNVTGKLCDVDRIAASLHRHVALAFFDYATASSYTKIDMNPVPSELFPSTSLVAKDAVFLSPHKMLGGVGTPGVLIIKKYLVSQVNAPSRSGGGTVFYVTNTHHRFLSNRIERYEGGTPNVAGIMRVGLTFLMKRKAESKYRVLRDQQEGEQYSNVPRSIEDYDCSTYVKVASYLKKHAPNLVLLGNDDGNNRNLPVFSFLIRFGKRFLHYNYVCAILNDVFGIQSRGGCQCAGPYSQKLLGLVDLTEEGERPNVRNEEIEDALYRFKERAELLRPGYTRLSLPFKGTRAAETDYVMKALVWVARNGWALMCQYRCSHRTGEWRHHNRQGKPLGRDERRWLSHYNLGIVDADQVTENNPVASANNVVLDEALANADKILAVAKTDHRSIAEAIKMVDADLVLGKDDDGKLEELRWYVYPKECALLLSEGRLEPLDEGNVIVGALDPLARSSPVERGYLTNDRKRKPWVNVDASVQRAASDPMDIESSEAIVFRDGEHNGKARLKEIIEGVEDEELSKCCEVFDANAGEWTLLDVFVRDTVETVKADANKYVTEVEVTDATELVTGNARKKASRTSSTWGQRNDMPHSSGQLTEGDLGASSMDVENGPGSSFPPSAGVGSKKPRFRHVKPPPKLMRMATQAIVQWDMIKDGDRLLLGLSGGKDSLSLLHCLLEFQRKLPIRFEIDVCTIDPMTPSFDPSPLIPYVESLGLKYHYIRDDIVSRASNAGNDGKMVSSLCAFCARMKRGNLYSCARRNNCNKLVLAQHLDDCAESLMMSMMHNGFLRTMKANYPIDAGDISVIRPLIYARESLMTEFAKAKNLPVINENCPACFEEPKERARIKKMLSREETLYPNFYDNIRRSLIPLMHDDMAAILRSYTEEAVSRSRKIPYKRPNGSENTAVGDTTSEGTANGTSSGSLSDVSELELILELARRKAARYSRSMKSAPDDIDDGAVIIPDATGQVCTLNGENGSIPCRELME